MKAALDNFLNASRVGGAFIVVAVLTSIFIFALETEYTNSVHLKWFSSVFALAFGLEYCLRFWIAGPTFRHKLDYALSFDGVIDLIAFLPALLVPTASGTFALRILRLTKLLRIIKVKALRSSIQHIGRAILESRAEILVSFCISVGLIFIGSVMMWIVEGAAQPEAFGSVPRAMWWAMATLTTVGYGDTYPITVLGKLVASALAIVGIAAVALPAGIFASAFQATRSKD